MMWRYVAGSAAALLLITAGIMLSNGSARPVSPLMAAPAQAGQVADEDEALPDTIPEAGAKTREEKRFNRYDKDRDGAVTREEYLVSRRKAYAKLDLNHDGQLSFDEWATKTTTKFADADKDKSGAMNAAEFATTAPKRRAKAKPNCPPAAPRDEEG
ncbi:histidine kinase [Sphingomonas sp. So64.6b]|uniref:histidine kinase n=1 Tax=Sphingomonas sp. So64.6b TaxID=2997354 RepID=UPI0031F6C0C7